MITADGRRGVITRICECDRCKSRGSFEIRVSFDDNFNVWITNTNLHLVSQDFYSIGDYVFGNIDENSLFDRLAELSAELKRISAQLTVIKRIRDEQGE